MVMLAIHHFSTNTERKEILFSHFSNPTDIYIYIVYTDIFNIVNINNALTLYFIRSTEAIARQRHVMRLHTKVYFHSSNISYLNSSGILV